MKIGADGSYLRFPRTGLARLLDGLLHALPAAIGPDDSLNVYYNSFPGPRLFPPSVRERFIRMPKATAWNQVGVPAAVALDRCDVYLGAANIIPALGSFPKVVVFADCIPFADPAAKPGSIGRYLRRWMSVSARTANRVVAISQWTAEQCQRHLGLDATQIVVIHPGVDSHFRPGPADPDEEIRLRSRLGITAQYVLHVGGFEIHKGGALLMRAVDILREGGLDLTLVRCGGVGPDRGRAGAIDLGHVNDATLCSLYRHAAVVCVPSRHEGFGLPVLEAMASGTPVVASRAGGLPEAGGEAAIFVEPDDAAGLAGAIDGLLSDPVEWNRRREAGIRHASAFTWAAAASGMLGVLREAGRLTKPSL